MPFDAIKTHMQKVQGKSSLRSAANEITSSAGTRGLFVGWRIRFAMYLLHAMMTVDLLDKLEVKTRKMK